MSLDMNARREIGTKPAIAAAYNLRTTGEKIKSRPRDCEKFAAVHN